MMRMAAILGLFVSSIAVSQTSVTPVELTAGTVIGPALRSTNLERSIIFYTKGMGLTLARRIDTPTGTEIAFAFGQTMRPPIIMLFSSKDPAKEGPIVMGNGFGRTLLSVADADALFVRLKAGGYAPGDVKTNSVNHMKTFWVKDPDGYAYEITQIPTSR